MSSSSADNKPASEPESEPMDSRPCSASPDQDQVSEQQEAAMRRAEDRDTAGLGFKDLCHYIEKCVARKYKVDKAQSNTSATMIVESLQSAKYEFSDLEDMYLGIVKHGQDTAMMVTELGDTIGMHKKKFPSDIPPQKLLKCAVEFFHQEPLVQRKLKPKKKESEKKEAPKRRKSPSRSTSKENDRNVAKKFAKYENLRPLSSCLLSSLAEHSVPHFKTKKIVGEIVDRIVTAGYNWDRLLCYHAKSQATFSKKLIPYFFMSKDELPVTLTPEMLLEKLYDFIDDSKLEVSTLMSSVALPELSVQKTSLLKPQALERAEVRRERLGKRKSRTESASASGSSTDSDSDDSDARSKQKMKRKRRNRNRKDSSPESGSDSEKEKVTRKAVLKPKVEVKSDPEPQSPTVSETSSNDLEKIMNSADSENKDKQKQSLLEKVNEIIKSCVRLKDEKKISGTKLEKANKIIAKAEAKKIKLLKQESKENDEVMETEQCKDAEPVINFNLGDEIEKEPSLKDVEEGEITDDDNEDDEVVAIEEVKKDENSNEKIKKKKRSKDYKERKRRYYQEDFYQRTVSDELQAMSGRDNRITRMSLDNPARSRSRSASASPEHSYRKKAAAAAAVGRYSHHQYRHRSRSPSSGAEEELANSDMNRWIPITPCTIQEDVEVEPMSTVMVNIKAKGEFSFKDNPGCFVRITKWTGKDNVNFMVIKPQIVQLVESSCVRVEVSNPYPDKFLHILRHDKIACMSILSATPPSSLFSRLNCSPERYQSADKRWFKVTTVVLHRKGSLDKISISPGKTLKVVGTVIGPLKKHIGRDVLISELDVGDPVPLQSQIARITDNEKIGINISNRGRRTLIIEKTGQAIATVSVWANVGPDVTFFSKPRFPNREPVQF